AGYRYAAPPFGLDRTLGVVSVAVLIQIDNGYVGSLPRIEHRDGTPDARIAAGDERNHVLELPRTLIVRRLIHGGWVEPGFEARLFQMLLGKGIRVGARARLHGVGLLLCFGDTLLVGAINLLLNDLSAPRGLLGVFCEGVKLPRLPHDGISL